MKFSDKLAKLRKDRNLSQEQLAEKLDVSRQAVSKWESGISYPDMNKMLTICKILDCTLDELMDDGVIKEEVAKEKAKVDVSEYFHDFLNYITRIYNMFIAMSFKNKIKCFFEIGFLALVLFIIGGMVAFIFRGFLNSLLSSIMNQYVYYAVDFIMSLFVMALFLLGTVILFHIFKIRYLDYYITVVDSNVSEKVIEKSIDKNDKKTIIIRDPKHSSNRFLEFIYRSFILIVKFFVLLFGLFIIFLFICGSALAVVGIYHGFAYNLIFAFMSMAIAGGLACLYIVIDILYRFIFNLKQNFKILFYVGMIGISVLGAGIGLSFINFLNVDIVKEEVGTVLDVYTIEDIDEQTEINYPISFLEFVEDETVDGVKIEINHFKDEKVTVTKNNNSNLIDINFLFNSDYSSFNKLDNYKKIMNNLKDNKFIEQYYGKNGVSIVVYAKKEVIDNLSKSKD